MPKPATAARRRPSPAKGGAGTGEPPRPWIGSYPDHVRWDAPLKPQPLGDFFDAAVARFSDEVCTDFFGATMTYGEIGAWAGRLAHGLQGLGIGPGSRVGLLLPNTPWYVVAYFAVLKTGATVVNFNPLYTAEEIDKQARDADLAALVTLDLKILWDKAAHLLEAESVPRAVVCPFTDLLPRLKRLAFRLVKAGELAHPLPWRGPGTVHDLAELTANEGRPRPVAVEPATAVALLQYTGGTTGLPKGAMLSHANLTVNVQQVLLWAPHLEPGKETVLAILPFFHVFAMTAVMNFGLAIGARLVLLPRFELAMATAAIRRTKPTIFHGVPTLYNAFLNDTKIRREDFASLKFCISGGAPLPLEVRRRFEELTGADLVEGYGLSETSPVATCNPIGGLRKDNSIGQPLPGTTVAIRALEPPHRRLAPGEDGEICIGGPQVMLGYWRRPDDTAQVMIDGELRTGDVGHLDDDGFVYIVDRIKDLIIASGFKVYPRVVEDAIYEHPAVEEVTVVGVPDPYRGEAPKAFVKLKAGERLDAEALAAFLEPKLSRIEMPAEIEFRDALPKTMIGKLSKKELRGA